MRKSLLEISVSAFCLFMIVGCVVEVRGPGPYVEAPPPPPAVEVSGPVIEGPGVVAIDVEPDPGLRVYVYDPGYPPGAYFYNGFYWYGGYRYEHDVFIHSYVEVNIRENRYVNVEENRRAGQRIEAQHRAEFAKTGGRVSPAAIRQRQEAAQHPQQTAAQRTQQHDQAAAQQWRPQAQPENKKKKPE